MFPNSSAKVGPLETVDEKKDSASAENTSAAESATDFPEPVSESKTVQKPSVDTEPEPESKPTVSGALSSPESVDKQSQTITTPSADIRKHELPENPPAESVNPSVKEEIAIEYGAVVGKVALVGENGQQLPATGTMITLTPKGMTDEMKERPSQVHIIDMEDKTYKPRYSTIHAGDQVVFVNKDNIRHNVFSSSGNNAFDLGTYGAGLKRAVTLEEPGIVKIYCNIHSEMATFVAVGNQGLSVRADDQGRYQIDDVLPGSYEVTIWNIRGETKRVIEVEADKTIRLADRIDTTASKVEPHKNKFGGDYSKNSTMFEDEFY